MSPEEAEAEITALAERSLDELKERWFALKGVAFPKYMRRGLMNLALAHAIREAAYGGLDGDTQRILDRLAAQITPTNKVPVRPPRRIKRGTRLIREWQGRVHEVLVVEGGFAWEGETHPSLSSIARKITGTRWNGWVFFGLKTPGRGKQRTASVERKRIPKSRRDKVAGTLANAVGTHAVVAGESHAGA